MIPVTLEELVMWSLFFGYALFCLACLIKAAHCAWVHFVRKLEEVIRG